MPVGIEGANLAGAFVTTGLLRIIVCFAKHTRKSHVSLSKPHSAISPAQRLNPGNDPWAEDEAQERARNAEPRRWTAAEAAELRKQAPAVSPWRVVRWQIIAGSVIAAVAGLIAQSAEVAWSAAYGALTVVLPAAVLARGLTSPLARIGAISSAMSFMVWEMVKIGLSVAMLILATAIVPGLSWPALLLGLILTIKVYWLAAVIKPKPANSATQS
jgi:ATP synthase protein I